MVISHKHKFIFLHCRKVAGSSITSYLNRFLGPADLQVGSWEDAIAFGGRYNRRALLDVASMPGITAAVASGLRATTDMLTKGYRPKFSRIINAAIKARYKGITGTKPEQPLAEELRRFVPDEWDTYFKFCFVRNPYDRAVSDYKWRTKGHRGISFLEFLRRLEDPTRPDPEGVVPRPVTNWPIYTIDDTVAVDFVGRFESLSEDFAQVCKQIRIPFDASKLPHAKKRRSRDDGYHHLYGLQERNCVEQVFAHELSLFDYRF